jgi:hypothetical protein
MTYRCGIGPGMERFGLEPGEPHITCDSCGLKKTARTRTGGAPAWLLDDKPPKGWFLFRQLDRTRIDYCPTCRGKYIRTVRRGEETRESDFTVHRPGYTCEVPEGADEP